MNANVRASDDVVGSVGAQDCEQAKLKAWKRDPPTTAYGMTVAVIELETTDRENRKREFGLGGSGGEAH